MAVSGRKPRKASRVWALAPAAFLVVAGWHLTATLARTPAFNAGLRVEAPDGGAFPHFLPAMYSTPDYLLEIGRDWATTPGTTADGVLESLTRRGAEGGMFTRLRRIAALVAADAWTQDEAEHAAKARRARDLVTESLRLGPANPDAWLLLAEVNRDLGDLQAAVDAYEVSRVLAPHSTTFALMRLGFLERLLASEGGREIARARIGTPGLGAPEVEADRRAVALLGHGRSVDNPVIVRFLERIAASR